MFYLILRKTLPIETLSDEKVLSYTSHFLVWKTNSLNLSYYFCSLHANFLPWVSCLLALSLALSPASWLCLYLLSVARSLKNSERKKTKMFDIYHTELCIVFALDLCNCVNLSSSYPILWYTLAVLMIFFILITYLLTMYWLCKEKLNWFTFVSCHWKASLCLQYFKYLIWRWDIYKKKYVFPKILDDIATNFSSNFEDE